MGQFSYITQDTNEPILIDRNFEVTMLDNKGNGYLCPAGEYEGYGEFGGKDFYELLAEMNGKFTRDEGIDIAFGDEPYISPNLVHDPSTWKYNPHLIVENDPNQGWGDDEDEEEWGCDSSDY